MVERVDTIAIFLNGQPVHFLAPGCGTVRGNVRAAHKTNTTWEDPDVCDDARCFRCHMFQASPCTEKDCSHIIAFGARKVSMQ